MKRTNIAITTISTVALAVSSSVAAFGADDQPPAAAEISQPSITQQDVVRAGSISQALRNVEPVDAAVVVSRADVVQAASLSQALRNLDLLGGEAATGTAVSLDEIVRTGSLSQVLRNIESAAEPENLAIIDQQ